MAEGGMDNGNPWLDDQIDHDGDDDDDNDDEQVVDTTRPFQPGTASTPCHNGEQMKMLTFPREQSGLPDTSFQEDIPLLGDLTQRLQQKKKRILHGMTSQKCSQMQTKPQSKRFTKKIKKETPGCTLKRLAVRKKHILSLHKVL